MAKTKAVDQNCSSRVLYKSCKTERGRRLAILRQRIVQSGTKLLTLKEVNNLLYKAEEKKT